MTSDFEVEYFIKDYLKAQNLLKAIKVSSGANYNGH